MSGVQQRYPLKYQLASLLLGSLGGPEPVIFAADGGDRCRHFPDNDMSPSFRAAIMRVEVSNR